MNDADNQLPAHRSSYEPPVDSLFDEVADGGEQDQHALGHMIWRSIRDRMHWVIISALVLGLAAAAAGYFGTEPLYQSEGTFIVKPIVYVAGESTPFTELPPMWGDYLATVNELLTSDELRELATNDERWLRVVAEEDLEGAGFGKHLGFHRRGSMFTVWNQHPNKQASQASVAVLIDRFITLFNEREGRQEGELLENYRERKEKLEQDLYRLKQRQATVGEQLGITELALQYETKAKDLARINQMLFEAQMQLQMLEPDESPEELAKLSDAEIALRDPVMRQMLQQLTAVDQRIKENMARGYGREHRIIARDEEFKENLQRQVRDYADEYRMGLGSSRDSDDMNDALTQTQIEQLRARVEQLRKTYDKLQVDVLSLGSRLDKVQTASLEIEKVENELDGIQDKIEALAASQPVSGRIDVLSDPRVPMGPNNWFKRVRFAGMTGFAGAAFGVVLIVVIGLLDRSMRHVSDARDELPLMRILGVLPTLPDDLSDPEQAEMASMTVHHIRTLLQLEREDRSTVFAITGASAGSGKSSLTAALGLSFAASASKTLMIDADLVGAGLTHRVLGDEVSRYGLIDACTGRDLAQCVIEAPGIKGLDVLTIGDADSNSVASLSPKVIRQLVATARERYDVILIDSGPVLGSLEASMAVAEADGVVVVVSRGDQRSAVTRSVEHLQSLGARLSGMVFNHALNDDIARSSYGSMGSTSRSFGPRVKPASNPSRGRRYGPLGLAVTSYSVESRDDAASGNGSQQHGAA